MTSPTEQEIVARAIDETYAAACNTISYRFRDLPASTSDFEAILKTASKNVITALDQFRAKNAGEVEQALDKLANHLLSLDSGSGEGKLLVQAAALISTLRSAIAEKDEALKFYADTRRYNGPNQRNDFGDPYSEGPYVQSVERDRGSLARSRISDGAK